MVIVDTTATPFGENSFGSTLVTRRSLLQYSNWISAIALFVYAAGFSFAYASLSAGTGALLLFGAVQATMILWGLDKGERLNTAQIVGFFVAVIGLVVLVFPGLSAPPLAGSILMLGAGVAWSLYSLRGKSERNPASVTTGNLVRTVPFAAALSIIFRPVDTSQSWWDRLRRNIGRGHIRSRLCNLVQRTTRAESYQRRYCSTQRPSASCHRRNTLARRTDHPALRFRFCRCVRRNRPRRSNAAFAGSNRFPCRKIAIMMSRL
jgi:hypothetical protein